MRLQISLPKNPNHPRKVCYEKSIAPFLCIFFLAAAVVVPKLEGAGACATDFPSNKEAGSPGCGANRRGRLFGINGFGLAGAIHREAAF
jgi:hypothetical protein